MKVQTNAVNVLQRTSAYLRSGLLLNTPAWYEVVASLPPSNKFTREPRLVNPSSNENIACLKEASQHPNAKGLYKTRTKRSERRITANRLYKAPHLKFVEDKLREIFYQQHPWELSRPKILVENEGGEEYDWCNIQQLGKPLDGESVVQRTLYLLKRQKEFIEAYDQARFEFYRLRMQQEVEQQVAQEEAEMFGSVYGPSAIEFGVEQEQKVIDAWKQRAIEETELLSARRANPSESWSSNANEENEREQRRDEDGTEEVIL